MDLIKTGIGIGKTIRNVGRLRDIVSVFARHGFAEFISSGVTSKIPDFVLPSSQKDIKREIEERGDNSLGKTLGYRLRLCFEELGPAFIKFGQLLGSREDIFDKGFIEEMNLLRDNVKPVSLKISIKTIEESLGRAFSEVFESIDDKPVGTASIGVVYKAKLLTGEEVVVKVRRPKISKEITRDFSILSFLANQVEKASEELKYLGLSRLVNDFAISLQNELNFNIEAMSCVRLKSNLEKHDTGNLFHLPQIYEEYTSEKVMVMEHLRGTPFSDKKIQESIEELKPKLDIAVLMFMKTFLQDGFFHADLHGGNFFYLDNGQIGLIDFGLMGTLGRKSRQNFVAIIYALLNYNYENLVYEFLDVADYDTIPDVDRLIVDVRDALSPFVGLTVQKTNFSHVIQAVIDALTKHKLFLPREWFIVFRSLITLDGVGRSLGIDFDIFEILNNDIKEIIKENFKKEDLVEDGIWAARDLMSSSRSIPRHLKWFVKEWSKKGYAFEIIHKGHEDQFRQVANSVVFLSFSLLACMFISCGVYFFDAENIKTFSQVTPISWIFFGLGLSCLFKGMTQIK